MSSLRQVKAYVFYESITNIGTIIQLYDFRNGSQAAWEHVIDMF